MATIPTTSHDAYLNSARRTYVATRAFNNDFFAYTVTGPSASNNYTTSGALSVVTSTASQTPAGRTLRENGKKLFPGANPGIGVYMVGVYDDQTGLSGYINPNAAVFAIYNGDKPTYLPDGSELAGGTFSGQNEGNAVYTLGDVTAGANVNAGGSILSSSSTAGVGYTTGAGSTVTQATNKSTAVTLDTVTGEITMNAAALADATTVAFTLNNTAIGANDLLIANHTSVGTVGNYTVQVAGCFTGSAVIRVTNVSGGSLSQAIKITFAVIKASST